MKSIQKEQEEICPKWGSSFVPADPNKKIGIALETLDNSVLNALRHPPEGDTTGWYIWGGDELLEDPNFFQPLHVFHLNQRCSKIQRYLGLAPGWRVLLAGDYVDAWFDESLLEV